MKNTGSHTDNISQMVDGGHGDQIHVRSEADHPVYNQTVTIMTRGSLVLVKVDTINEALISRYCVVLYDNKPYPGIIQDVGEDEVEVKAMHSIGRNRFFWPMLYDVLWYSQSQIVTLLQNVLQADIKN